MSASPNLAARLAGLTPQQRAFLARRLNHPEGPAIPRQPEGAWLPLSFCQESLWLLWRLDPDSPFYNIAGAVRIRGALDLDALERALDTVAARHRILGTRFRERGGEPEQSTTPGFHWRLAVESLEFLNSAARLGEARRRAEMEAARPFDLLGRPEPRARLYRLAGDDHVLSLTLHHILADGWSLNILIREIGLAYADLPFQPQEPPCQYIDFAVWQRDTLQGAAWERQLDYWRGKLAGAPPAIGLPYDHLRPGQARHRGDHCAFAIEGDDFRSWKGWLKARGATPFMGLLAAFMAVLRRYGGQDDFCVGAPFANRHRPQVGGLVGYFVNTLVLRAELRGDPLFPEWLDRVRADTLAAQEHQDVPFERLVEELRPARQPGKNPLFQVLFDWQEDLAGRLELPGLALEPFGFATHSAKFDLSLSVTEAQDHWRVEFEYDTDLFEPATVADLAGHYRAFLLRAARSPEARLSELAAPTLEAAARFDLWNATARDYPADCVHALFDAAAERWPERVAVRDADSALGYGELRARSDALARRLRAWNPGPEARFGLWLERSPEFFIALLGVLKAGCAYVPLDTAQPPARLAYILEDAGVAGVVTRGDMADRLPMGYPALLIDDGEASPAPRFAPAVDPGQLAYVIYTSGTTGRPKGVAVTHRNLVNQYRAWEDAYGLSGLRTHLQMANPAFDVFSGDCVRALCSGGTLVLCPRETLLQPEALHALLVLERVECAEFVPAVLRELVAHLRDSGQGLEHMRLLACGSDAWHAGEYREVQSLLGPSARLVNSFGLTETTIDSTYYEADPHEPPTGQALPIGRPFANSRIYVLDDRLDPVPVGVAGEIYIGGSGVARGYWNRPDLSAERFAPDPWGGSGARMYRTGDAGHWRMDGQLECLGRRDHQVKLRGYRIELGEIEAALRRHPALLDAVAIVREDRPGDRRLVAYCLAEAAFEGPALTAFLKECLPDYMVPAAFVRLGSWPLSANGKLDRKALPAPEWDESAESGYVAPRTETEARLAELWAALLDLPRVGRHDDFFALGGHSLLLMQVGARLRSGFGVALPVPLLFQATVLADLADALDAALALKAGETMEDMEEFDEFAL